MVSPLNDGSHQSALRRGGSGLTLLQGTLLRQHEETCKGPGGARRVEIKTRAKLPRALPCMRDTLYQDDESSKLGGRTEVLFDFDLGAGWESRGGWSCWL